MVRYAPEVAEEFLAGIRRGLSVRTTCKQPGMPAVRTVFDWLADPRRASFAEAYQRARRTGCEAVVDQLFEIVDDSSGDWVERLNIRTGLTERVFDPENVQRSRLRLYARIWYLSKLMPKVYGDKIEHEHKGNVDLSARLTEGRQRALSPQRGSDERR